MSRSCLGRGLRVTELSHDIAKSAMSRIDGHAERDRRGIPPQKLAR